MPLWWRTQVPDCRRSEPDNAAPALHGQELYTLGVLLEKGHIKPAYWQPFRKEPGPRESCRRGRRSPTKDAAQPVRNASRPLMVARSSHAGARFCRKCGWVVTAANRATLRRPPYHTTRRELAAPDGGLRCGQPRAELLRHDDIGCRIIRQGLPAAHPGRLRTACPNCERSSCIKQRAVN